MHELQSFIDYFNQIEAKEQSNDIKNRDAAAFLSNNAPRFFCSDATLTEIYWFRLWTYRKHIKSTPEGHVITEFLPDVPWAGAYNAIVCPAGHHINEGRWLADRRYMKDGIRHFVCGAGCEDVYAYGSDLLYATCDYCLSFGDLAFGEELLGDLLRVYRTVRERHRTAGGLFWSDDDRDGMEYSISGCGLRPTINSYLYGAAWGLAQLAHRLGAHAVACMLRDDAERLRELIETHLWDASDGFYKTVPQDTAQAPPDLLRKNGARNVRELVGYLPFLYPELADRAHDTAFSYLTDPTCFLAPYGPTTADQSHPRYRRTESDHECLWDGPSWPFATLQVLTAVLRRRRLGPIDSFSDADFVHALRTYAMSQYRTVDGRRIPWIDENLDPLTGEWVARDMLHARGDALAERGAFYNHSTFCDLVISGLCGVVPKGDHVELCPILSDEISWFSLENLRLFGKTYAVYYDRDGTHLGRGRGVHLTECKE